MTSFTSSSFSENNELPSLVLVDGTAGGVLGLLLLEEKDINMGSLLCPLKTGLQLHFNMIYHPNKSYNDAAPYTNQLLLNHAQAGRLKDKVYVCVHQREREQDFAATEEEQQPNINECFVTECEECTEHYQ